MEYKLDIKAEETGEHICTVEVDQDVIEMLVQRGFIEMLKDYLTPEEK